MPDMFLYTFAGLVSVNYFIYKDVVNGTVPEGMSVFKWGANIIFVVTLWPIALFV